MKAIPLLAMCIASALAGVGVFKIISTVIKDKPKPDLIVCNNCDTCSEEIATRARARERARIRAIVEHTVINGYYGEKQRAFWLMYTYACNGDIECLANIKFED